MTRICVVGAHTAVAKAFVECVEERDIEVKLDLTTTSDHLEDGLDLVGEDALRAADLVLLAFDGDRAKELAAAAMKLGKPVLDLSEALAGEKRAQWIFPGVDSDAGRSFDPAKYAIIPLGLAAPIVAILRGLAALEPTRAVIVTSESTAAADRAGMDELSDQVRARFNMRDVEPAVFGSPIAFSCSPVVGRAGASPFDADDVLRAAIEAGIEKTLPDLELSVTRTMVPTFSADSAVLVIELGEAPSEEAIHKVLEEARGIHFEKEELPSSLEAIGRDDVLACRVNVEPERVSLWIASDRLRRGSATLAALAVERFLAARNAN